MTGPGLHQTSPGLDPISPSIITWSQFKNDVLYANLLFKDMVWRLTRGPSDKVINE